MRAFMFILLAVFGMEIAPAFGQAGNTVQSSDTSIVVSMLTRRLNKHMKKEFFPTQVVVQTSQQPITFMVFPITVKAEFIQKLEQRNMENVIAAYRNSMAQYMPDMRIMSRCSIGLAGVQLYGL